MFIASITLMGKPCEMRHAHPHEAYGRLGLKAKKFVTRGRRTEGRFSPGGHVSGQCSCNILPRLCWFFSGLIADPVERRLSQHCAQMALRKVRQYLTGSRLVEPVWLGFAYLGNMRGEAICLQESKDLSKV
jgi:hypothetical protein